LEVSTSILPTFPVSTDAASISDVSMGSIAPDAFFLQKEYVSEPVDTEVECYLNDSARRALETMVNEQRKVATSVDITVETGSGGSGTRFSPSPSALNASKLPKTHPHVNSQTTKGHAKPASVKASSNSNISDTAANTANNAVVNKFTGGFYILKGHGTTATGVMAPVAVKCGRHPRNDDNGDCDVDADGVTSDDNDSASINGVNVGIVASPEFASIDSTVPNFEIKQARKTSDDLTDSTSSTFVEQPCHVDDDHDAPSSVNSKANVEKFASLSVNEVCNNEDIGSTHPVAQDNSNNVNDNDNYEEDEEFILNTTTESLDSSIDCISSDLQLKSGTSASISTSTDKQLDALPVVISSDADNSSATEVKSNDATLQSQLSNKQQQPKEKEKEKEQSTKDAGKFVTLHDDLSLLSDEALLSLSSLRGKIDEVDRIRAKREHSQKKGRMFVADVPNAQNINNSSNTSTNTNTNTNANTNANANGNGNANTNIQTNTVGRSVVTNTTRPIVPLKKWTPNGRVTKGNHRSAWEEPPTGRVQGTQLRHDKMFQSSLLPENVEEAATIAAAAQSLFLNSPGIRPPHGPSNFGGSRPNSRGAIAADTANATMKDAINAIIRTNATRGGDVGDLSVAVRSLRSVASRNAAQNRHKSSITPKIGLSPLDAALAEARSSGSSLIVSPRTAFDDCSISSTDSHRSYSSQYSTDVASMGSPRTKSALSRAMEEVESSVASTKPPTIQLAPLDLTSLARSTQVAKSSPQSSKSSTNVRLADSDKDDKGGNIAPITAMTPISVIQNNEENNMKNIVSRDRDDDARNNLLEEELRQEKIEVRNGRSTPILMPIPTVTVSLAKPGDMRQQSGSAPAQMSVDRSMRALRRSKESLFDDEDEELRGLF
jgi:hypothetical protein